VSVFDYRTTKDGKVVAMAKATGNFKRGNALAAHLLKSEVEARA
jgi:hypothetical protein